MKKQWASCPTLLSLRKVSNWVLGEQVSFLTCAQSVLGRCCGNRSLFETLLSFLALHRFRTQKYLSKVVQKKTFQVDACLKKSKGTCFICLHDTDIECWNTEHQSFSFAVTFQPFMQLETGISLIGNNLTVYICIFKCYINRCCPCLKQTKFQDSEEEKRQPCTDIQLEFTQST